MYEATRVEFILATIKATTGHGVTIPEGNDDSKYYLSADESNGEMWEFDWDLDDFQRMFCF